MEGTGFKKHVYAEMYPELGKGKIPMEVNTSPEIFELEREKIFKHSWLNVGRVEEVPNPGDYFVQDIPTLETSILIVRGKDNQVRAFHNMCKHRGNKVVHTGHTKGNAKGFSCAFHGWTYDLQGKLVIVPDEDQFFNLDKSCLGLTSVACDVWEGFIYINVDPNPKETLHEWMGEMADEFEGYFKDMHMYAHFAADVNCNWKIIIDAFAEAYHVPFIHGKTLPEAISGGHNPLCHLLAVHLFKRHRRISAPANPEYQPTPLEQKIGKFVSTPVFPALKADMDKLPPGINKEKHPMWGFDINIIHPISYFAAWANGTILVYHFWPVAVDKTRWEVKLYSPKPKTWGERINLELTGSMTISVVREDMSSLETTQEVYNSGAMESIHLSDQEIAVRHQYKVLDEALRS